MASIIEWKESETAGRVAEAQEAMSVIHVDEIPGNKGYVVKIAPTISGEYQFKPVVEKNFQSVDDAKAYAERFEVALLRNVARNKLGPDEAEQSGLVVKLDGEGKKQVKYTDREGTYDTKPKRVNMPYSHSLQGVRVPDKNDLGIVMGNDAGFKNLAVNASNAALDATQLARDTFTPEDAEAMLKRAGERQRSRVIGYNERNTNERRYTVRADTNTPEAAGGLGDNRYITLSAVEGEPNRLRVELRRETHDARRNPTTQIQFSREMSAREFITFASQVTGHASQRLVAQMHAHHIDLVDTARLADSDPQNALQVATTKASIRLAEIHTFDIPGMGRQPSR